MPKALILSCLMSLLILNGCSENRSRFEHHSYARLNTPDRNVLWNAAQATVQEYFGVETVDREAGLIRSTPSVETSQTGSSALGLSSPRRHRQIAEIWIEPSDGQMTTVRCRVLRQENSTTEQRAFSRQDGTEDAPNQTPLEEHQGMDEEGETGWTTLESNRTLERELLSALAERLAKESDEPK